MRLSHLTAVVLAVFTASAGAQKPTDNDKLPGEVWTFEAAKGELNRIGEFRIFEKKVYHGEKNLGTASIKGDEATLVVRGGGVLHGRVLLRRDRAGWRGVIHHGDGSRWSIVVRPKDETPKNDPKPKKPK
jgi:hypothetical protein